MTPAPATKLKDKKMDIYKRIRKPTAKPTIPHKDKNKYTRKEKHSKQEE